MASIGELAGGEKTRNTAADDGDVGHGLHLLWTTLGLPLLDGDGPVACGLGSQRLSIGNGWTA